jgi:hypothetical protein
MYIHLSDYATTPAISISYLPIAYPSTIQAANPIVKLGWEKLSRDYIQPDTCIYPRRTVTVMLTEQ